jgi:sugar lactone lactonase YvrE
VEGVFGLVMANNFTNKPRTSEDVTSLMRRINALERGAAVLLLDFSFAPDSETGILKAGWTDATNFYVVDNTDHEVHTFTLAGTFVSSFGSSGASPGDLNTPNGLALDSSGNFYVGDGARNKVIKFNSSGVFQSEVTFVNAKKVFIDSSDNVFCVGDDEVRKMNTSLSTLLSFGTSGSSPGEIGSAWGVCTDSSGNIWITDTTRDKVIKFNSSGVYQSEFGTSGSGIGEFTSLGGIRVDSFGLVFVTDFTRGKLMAFSSSGDFLYEAANTAGLHGYQDVHLSSTDKLYICDNNPSDDDRFVYVYELDQNGFFAYLKDDTKVSLGTPDGGVAIPSLGGLDQTENNASIAPNHILDMRAAIEGIAPQFKNGATGNAFNWTDASADNLYFVAMGDRTAYGATGGAAYDWTRDETAMIDTYTYDIDIGEIEETTALLEASDPVDP